MTGVGGRGVAGPNAASSTAIDAGALDAGTSTTRSFAERASSGAVTGPVLSWRNPAAGAERRDVESDVAIDSPLASSLAYHEMRRNADATFASSFEIHASNA